MKMIWVVVGVLVLALGGLVWWMMGSQSSTETTTSTPTSVSTKAPAATKKASLAFTVGETTKLFTGGYADPVTFKVGDEYHMFLNRFGQNFGPGQNGYYLLTSSDGIEWTETTKTQFPGIATGRVMQFGETYRFYYPTQASLTGGGESQRFMSASSTDGTTFTDEDGVRVTPRDGYSLEGMTVFALPDGTYRMYFNENLDSSKEQKVSEIWGASSTDGLTWTRDEEPTLKAETEELKGGGWAQMLHPFVLKRPSGGYVMFYNSHSRVFYATSQDGMTWTKQGMVIADGADVDGFYETDDTIRLYYGDFDPATGGLVYMTTLTEN